MHWSGVLLTAAVLGNLILWLTLLRWIYRLPLRHRVWTIVAAAGITIAIVTSGVMLRQVGLRGPKLLRRDSWQRTPVAWQAAVLFSSAVVLASIARAATSRLRYPTPSLVRARTRTVDVASILGTRPASTGLARHVARLPGNELYLLEVVDLELRLPRLPPRLDGLSIIHLSDLHLNGTPGLPYFQHVCAIAARMNPDLVVVTGDILDRPELASWLPRTVGQFRAPLGCYFVLGNHDVDTGVDRVRAAMTELGWTSVGGRTVVTEMCGERIVIAGTERPWIGDHPDLSNAPSDALRLLLSHTPHCFKWAKRHGVDLMLAGHLHGGQILRRRNLCGLFESDQTTMYLSRGVGEMSPPLRWRCKPELTRLVLRTSNP